MTDTRHVGGRSGRGSTVAPVHSGLGESQHIRVLLYHRILQHRDGEDWADIAINEKAFVRQMEMLDRWGYTAITFDDYRLYLSGELNLPRKPVIITFDDAYSEVHDVAFPIMRKFGMRGVVFVVGDLSLRTNAWDKEHGPEYRLMSVDQLLELHENGFEVGSHTITHPRLLNVDADMAWMEIFRSRTMLEILVNNPVRSFAYPYGDLNAALKDMVREAGYTIGCAAFSGPAVFGDDPFEVRRIKPRNSSGPIGFWLQLRSVYLYYRWIIWRLRNLTRSRDTFRQGVA